MDGNEVKTVGRKKEGKKEKKERPKERKKTRVCFV